MNQTAQPPLAIVLEMNSCFELLGALPAKLGLPAAAIELSLAYDLPALLDRRFEKVPLPTRRFGQPAKGLAHRALADIRESIRELEYYRRTIFVPLPGPDVEAAKAIAATL